MEIIRYEAWAKPGSDHPGTRKMTLPVANVFIHHAAGPTPMSLDAEVSLLRQYDAQHRAKGWDGLGYSFVVGPSGRVYEGRGEYVGAHTEGHNSKGFGICLLGNFQESAPTPAAMASLIELIFHLERVHAVRFPATIRGHRDVGATACPGNKLYAKLPEVRDALQGDPMPEIQTPIYKVNAAPVSLAITPSGQGYIILCADGGVFTFGDAVYLGRVESNGSW